MDKQEPKIIVGIGTTNEELLQWMSGKVEAANMLSDALKLKGHREVLAGGLDARIEDYTRLAAIEVLSKEELAEGVCVSEGVFSSQPDLLQVSSEILKVVKVELVRQNVQPSVENIRCVLSLIDGSMPAFTI